MRDKASYRSFLPGELGRRIAAYDWSRTSLGPIEGWPASLRSIVDLMLASRQPAYIAWGAELVSLYNDGYIPILGTKHPDGLGKPYAELFAEVWHEYAPVVAATMAGEAQHFVDQPVALVGRPGRTMSWFTYSWTPLRDEAGEVRGFYCAATETTEGVQAARSLREARDEALRRSEERRDAALAAARLGTFEWDLTTNAVILDARSREIFGFAPGEGTEARQVFDRIHPEDRARVRAEAHSSENSLSRLVTEYRVQLPEGPVRTVASLSDAVIGPDGRAARMAAWRWNPREDRVTFSSTAAEVFGLPAGEAFGSSAEALGVLHPDGAERHSAIIQDARERGTTWHSEFRIIRPRDGKLAWLEERAASERDDATGEPQMTGLIWDITERKMAEEQQALLAREVDHRAKNALAVVQAALRLTKASSLPDYIAVMEGRVSALARAQTLLARDRWSGADLRTLLDGELAPFLGSGQRTLLDGPAVMLPAHTAQPLAMTLHELATNAVKYGALSSEAGHVSVTWTVEGMPSGVMLRLRWAEAGGPPLSSPPRRMGFGSRVLEGTIRSQLGGSVSLEWEATGLVCVIGIPLQREAAHQDGADK